MTRFQSGNVNFGCRVAAVILHKNHVLLQGEPEGTYWTLPGGGIEMLEPTQIALQREMWEELHIRIHIDRLLWFVEQFFEDGGHQHHELALLFYVMPVDAPHLFNLEHTFHAQDGKNTILFRWFPLEDLQSITLYPSFLAQDLRNLPQTPQMRIEQSTSLPRQFLTADIG